MYRNVIGAIKKKIYQMAANQPGDILESKMYEKPFMMNLPREQMTQNQYLQRNPELVKRKTNTIFRIVQGNITDLPVDCIVLAYPYDVELRFSPSNVKITTRGKKSVIHVVEPMINSNSICDYSLLKQAYIDVLNLANDSKMKSIAFSCLSTGEEGGFDKEKAADSALNTIRLWLQNPKQEHSIEKVIFAVDSDEQHTIYSNLLVSYQDHGWLGSVRNQKAQIKINEIKNAK
jgi:O-acetyl-ADP-ribose deacetylase (regulator of RNase III)